MKDLVVNKVPAQINFNYEEVKESLQEAMQMYEGIIVTEDNLKDCKATQKDLSKLSKDIDTYRKGVKKDLEKPIKDFETKCKELINMVSNVEKPIKEGIKEYDDKTREEKRVYAQKCIDEVIKTLELNPKYAELLTIVDQYCNLSTTQKFVREDIASRANVLKQQQEEEKNRKELIKTSIVATVEGANQGIEQKLKAEDFYYLIERGFDLAQVINEINKVAARIKNTEDQTRLRAERKIEEEKRRTEQEALRKIEEEKKRIEIQSKRDLQQELEKVGISPEAIKQEEPTEFTHEINITLQGSKNKLMALSQYLKANGYSYKVEYQKVL